MLTLSFANGGVTFIILRSHPLQSHPRTLVRLKKGYHVYDTQNTC